MRVNVTHHYGANETQGCWNIHFANVTSGWAGDGLTKVEAAAEINYNMMLDRLSNEGLINKTTIDCIVTYLQHRDSGITFQQAIAFTLQANFISNSFFSQADFDRASAVLNEVLVFCNNRKQVIRKSAYSFCDAFVGGNSSSFESAKKKIKKELSLDSTERIYALLKSHLQSKRLI